MISFSSEKVEYHRLKIFTLSSFRLILTDQNGKELDFHPYNGSEQSYRANTHVKLHFRRIGTHFKGVRPEDRVVRIKRPMLRDVDIFETKRTHKQDVETI